MVTEKTRTIAVANEKGGVGKTVTVINLGAALSKLGKKILVLDMDPQANSTKGLGVELEDGDRSIYELIQDPKKNNPEDFVISTQWEGLFLIPSHVDLAGAEVELVDVEGRENLLRRACKGLSDSYDFILLDTPPSLSLLTVNVLTFARELIVPCQTHPYAYGALEDLFDTVEAINEEINPDLKVSGIVATFFDQRTLVSQNILDKLKNHEEYGPLLFDSVVRVNTTIAASAEVGKPVVFYRSGSYGAQDYRGLAREVVKRRPG